MTETSQISMFGLIKKFRLIKINEYPEFLIIWLQFQKKKQPVVSWFPLTQINYVTSTQTDDTCVTKITLHMYSTGIVTHNTTYTKSFCSQSINLTNSLILKLLDGKVQAKENLNSLLYNNLTPPTITTDLGET